MEESTRTRFAATFGVTAASYERGRPPYPQAALDWLLPDGAGQICDLGAGTGKLTRQLIERGLEVWAVDPAAEMLAELRRAVPAAHPVLGSAETTNLPDRCVDAVFVAQAWHWVDPERAVPEMSRILRPGGTLALLWNLRTHATEFGRRLDALLGGSDQERWNHTDPSSVPGSPFQDCGRHDVEWSSSLPSERLVDLAASRSYVIAMEAAERDALLESVGELAGTYADEAGQVEIPYLTRCLRFAGGVQ